MVRSGGAPGRRRAAWLASFVRAVFLAASLRCQASSVMGATGRLPPAPARDELRERGEPGRSAGSCCTRPAFRRSTTFSCRSASNSGFWSASPRTTWTASLDNQRISRQTILSGTWSASHHRVSLAGERTGQRHDRGPGGTGTPSSRHVLTPCSRQPGSPRRLSRHPARTRSRNAGSPASAASWTGC